MVAAGSRHWETGNREGAGLWGWAIAKRTTYFDTSQKCGLGFGAVAAVHRSHAKPFATTFSASSPGGPTHPADAGVACA